MEKKIEAAETLAQYAASLKYEDIPTEVRESAKRSILDTLGVAIAASTQGEGYRELVELIKDGSGTEESTILAFGGKVPAWMAAFANGAMARALDYDDTYDEAITHPSSTTVPATLAIAERLGKISGKELITAVTLGNDITSRMGLSICLRPRGWKPDWFLTTVHGVFGATAACSKLLELDASKIQNALGIALYESAGTLEAFSPGAAPMMTGMATGFTAQAAVFSALMAQRGITGARDSLEGKAGLYNVYFGGDYNRDVLIGNLGKKFGSAGISIKPWPGVRFINSYIDATLQLVREHDIASQDIRQITLFAAGWAQTLCEPLEMRRRPSTRDDANRSLPYLVAVAATKRKVTSKDLSPEAIKDPATLQFARRVTYKHDDRFGADNKIGPAMVGVELMNGKSYSKQLDIAYGHPRNPITWQDLTDKFRDCASSSAKPLSRQNIEKTIVMVSHLEEIDNVSQIIHTLA